jgi:transcriptional regulator with XRE-family HTH domain
MGNNIMSLERMGMTLKRLRTARGMTQVTLAKRAKVTQGYIAQFERGDHKNPGLAVLRRLARALRVTVGELVA